MTKEEFLSGLGKVLAPDRKYLVYFAVVFLSSLILLFIECLILRGFYKTTDTVMGQYEQRIEEYKQNTGLNKQEIAQLATIMQADSTQYAALQFFMETKKDNPYDRATELLEDTKDVLEFQMTSVKSEYQSLEIWVGILTIVFLVFSFYSFYRMDRMIESGSETLNHFQAISTESIKSFDDLKEEYIEDLVEEKVKLVKDISEAINRLQTSFDALKDGANNDYTRLRQEIDYSFKEKQQSLEANETKLQNKTAILEKQFSDCLDKIKSMENSISEMENKLAGINDISKLQTSIEVLEKELGPDGFLSQSMNKLKQRIGDIEFYQENNPQI